MMPLKRGPLCLPGFDVVIISPLRLARFCGYVK